MVFNKRARVVLLPAIALALIGVFWLPSSTTAQPRITDTPLPVVIPQSTPQPTSLTLLTPTPTFTMTPEAAQIRLVAAAPAADINVRDFPDVTGARLGSLEPGQEYAVTGVYFQWYQFEYAASPTGRAWVFGDLVEIIGDAAAITPVDPNVQPTAESAEQIGTATAEAQLLTPEFAATASADARVLTLPPEEQRSAEGFPPTFTPPPEVAARLPTLVPDALAVTPQSDLASQVLTGLNASVPPLVPIVALISVGILGLLIGIARR